MPKNARYSGDGPDDDHDPATENERMGDLVRDRTTGDGSATTSKQADGEATNDVDTIAEDLLNLEDPETARHIARIITRLGDTVGELNE